MPLWFLLIGLHLHKSEPPKKEVDTDVNNDDYSQSFTNPRKHNNSTTELCNKNITTTQFKLKSHKWLYQQSL